MRHEYANIASDWSEIDTIENLRYLSNGEYIEIQAVSLTKSLYNSKACV